MNTDTDIRAALISAAQSFLTQNATIQTASGVESNNPTINIGDIAWENRTFDPASKDVWASVFYRPNIPTARTIGGRGIDEINGFLQIDLNIAPNSGEGELIKWEKKARIFFHGGRKFIENNDSALVTSCGMSQGRHVDNHFRKSITVAFRGQLKRSQVTN